jgi:hypothetical protein
VNDYANVTESGSRDIDAQGRLAGDPPIDAHAVIARGAGSYSLLFQARGSARDRALWEPASIEALPLIACGAGSYSAHFHPPRLLLR